MMDIENPKILMKNNVLIQAKYSLSLVENRIFLLMMYKLQRESEGVLSCEISHEEFRQVIKHTKDRTVKSISNSLSSLRKKSIFFMEEKKNGKGIIWGEYGFLNGFTFDVETSIFKIEASQKIYDLLNTYLQTGYTPANLAVLFSMKNYYAQRLYDLLRLWSGTKNVINYTVADLKMYLQLEDNYPEYGNFKRRIIIPAVKELNQTGYFVIDFKENKIGRKVDSLDFLVQDLDKRRYFDKKNIDQTDTINEFYETSTSDSSQSLLNESIEILTKNKIDINKQELIVTNQKKQSHKEEESLFFIPDEDVFSKGTMRLFKKDFSGYNFKEKINLDSFEDAVAITFEKDDVETIETRSYQYFKGALLNRIEYYKNERKEEEEHQKEIQMYWWQQE
ncbi:replication initiation protein [Romboutsia sp.]|uniref:replication initiation protein n=1 Tax=Romboutsia sp. TaxID=1965302 RepID=UPI003F2F5E91